MGLPLCASARLWRGDALLRTQKLHNYRNYDNRDNNRPPSRPAPPVVVHAQWSRYVSAKVNVVSLARRRVKLANDPINESGKPRERVHRFYTDYVRQKKSQRESIRQIGKFQLNRIRIDAELSQAVDNLRCSACNVNSLH